MGVRTITIIVRDDDHFDVHEGESVARALNWDELLGEIGRLTFSDHAGGQGRYMRHIDAELARQERMRKRAKEAARR